MELPDFLTSLDGVAYATDSESRIIAVGRGHWDAFATENGAPELGAGAVIGRDLFDWIEGDEVRRLYRDRIAHVVREREPVVLAMHCNSPGVDRRIRLAMTPMLERDVLRGILYQAQILEETIRPPVDLFDFQSIRAWTDEQRKLPIVWMCSFCARVAPKEPADAINWIVTELYYQRGGTSRVRISHGICPACDIPDAEGG